MADKRFDAVYDFRIAKCEEIPMIMKFIGNEWGAGHILSCNRVLFEYEYRMGCMVNVMLAIRRANGEIEGILGFKYASEDEGYRDVWGSMWKVRNGNMLFLGIEIMQRLLEQIKCRTYLALGINLATTGKIVKRRYAWVVGRMKHWYMLDKRKIYKIAVIKEKAKSVRPAKETVTYKVKEVGSIFELESVYNFKANVSYMPYKDRNYIKRRYFEYPFYSYKVYTISDTESEAKSFLVTRKVTANGADAIRIVDFVGDKRLICGINQWAIQLLRETKAEYIDFYEFGFMAEDLTMAGFTERTKDDENIIPNHFSPFRQENIEIYFHAPDGDITICKADGDQDRPN